MWRDVVIVFGSAWVGPFQWAVLLFGKRVRCWEFLLVRRRPGGRRVYALLHHRLLEHHLQLLRPQVLPHQPLPPEVRDALEAQNLRQSSHRVRRHGSPDLRHRLVHAERGALVRAGSGRLLPRALLHGHVPDAPRVRHPDHHDPVLHRVRAWPFDLRRGPSHAPVLRQQVHAQLLHLFHLCVVPRVRRLLQLHGHYGGQHLHG